MTHHDDNSVLRDVYGDEYNADDATELDEALTNRSPSADRDLHLEVPSNAWAIFDAAEGIAHLKCTLWINGVGHHMEAYLVEPDSDPQMTALAVNDSAPITVDVLDVLELIHGGDGKFHTNHIVPPGETQWHEYVIVTFPMR